YVNNAYLPAVMEPFGNPLIGWIGAANTIDGFTEAIKNFRNTPKFGVGWPVYKGTAKIASALEIFLSYVPAQYDPNLTQSAPVIAMRSLWQTCTSGGAAPICPVIRDVTALLDKNFDNYRKGFFTNKQWGCTGKPEGPAQGPAPQLLLLKHLYGWGPFNTNCAANANLLQNTPGYTDPIKKPNYQTVKNEFDLLQYYNNFPVTGTYGQFDPFVGLIHGKNYINAPYVYAYSVDDAFGNMQTDGTGLVIEVGGTDRLPNPDHATPNVHVPFGVSSTDPIKKITVTFQKYGRCTTDTTKYTAVNPNFPSFDLPLEAHNT